MLRIILMELNRSSAVLHQQRKKSIVKDTLLLMRVGANPLIVRKLRYYVDKEFAGMFDVA